MTEVLVIHRRITPTKRLTYWIDHPQIKGMVQMSGAEAKRLVEMGRARWAANE